MKKLYLGIGINNYRQFPLRGCVNDVEDLFGTLIRRFGFERGNNMRLLFDQRATKQAIVDRLDWLVSNSQSGDIVVFHYSGHGSQIATRDDKGEVDALDEILIPYDCYLDWDKNCLKDNLLGEYDNMLYEKGVIPIFIIDACHSGTMTRDIYRAGYEDRASRFMPIPLDIEARAYRGLNKNPSLKDKNMGILVSGCQDNQTSMDAFMNGRFNGAMTRSLVDILEEFQEMNWVRVEEMLRQKIKLLNFAQIPSVTGKPEFLKRQTFT